MPAAASDQVSNEADAPVPPARFVVYPAVLAVDGTCLLSQQSSFPSLGRDQPGELLGYPGQGTRGDLWDLWNSSLRICGFLPLAVC